MEVFDNFDIPNLFFHAFDHIQNAFDVATRLNWSHVARYAFHKHAVLVQLTVAHVVELVHEVISLPQSTPKREHEDVEDDCCGNSEHERYKQHVLVARHVQNCK